MKKYLIYAAVALLVLPLVPFYALNALGEGICFIASWCVHDRKWSAWLMDRVDDLREKLDAPL